jgi:hypothetical protein
MRFTPFRTRAKSKRQATAWHATHERAHKIWKDTLNLHDNAKRAWQNSAICANFADKYQLLCFLSDK